MKNLLKLSCQETIKWFGRFRLSFWLGGMGLGCLSVAAENVILFIGDGMGYGQIDAARCFHGGPLSFEGFPDRADCTTHSADNAITDSAAAGTAIATAFKVNNGVISLALPGDGRELETLLEFYQKRGKKVGLVTTTYLTHATPATFGAHASSRNNTAEIGADLLNQTRPNVLFGGGGYGLDAASAAAAGYAVATDTAGFNALDPAAEHLAALFGSGLMPYEYDYPGETYPYPHLADLVEKALTVLPSGPEGFFLMVEGGMIDQACHANHLPRAVQETLAFSRAVQVALDWVGSRTDTTVVVTADHETGGLTVTQDNGPGNYPTVTWSTTGHTAARVPVYAWRRNAELVRNTLDNTDFFNLLTAESIFSPVLARVAADVVDETSVRVTWFTDVPASSQVEYGTISGSYSSSVSDNTLTTTHSVSLNGLTSGQPYYYRVTSQDAGASVASSAEYTFTPVSLSDPGLLVASGSVWKYHDQGTDLGTAWREPAYDDSAWPSGPAQLGYGDGDEATVISYGTDANQKHPCAYFRHAFAIDYAGAYVDLTLSVLRDDGAVVYLNGIEVARYNLPSGTIAYSTLASSASDFAWDAAITIPNLLVDGVNVLAVEVHQASASSSDLSLDLKLNATRIQDDGTPPVLSAVTVTGITDNSAVVTWTTDEPADSRVQYGLSEEFGLETGSPALVTDHRVDLSGLAPNTTYFFVVRSADANGNAGFGAESSFVTVSGNPPTAPSGLIATAQSTTAIELTWTDTSANETGFEIRQSVDGQSFMSLGTVGPNETRALVTGLQRATTYYFIVRAFNGFGSADSGIAPATTLALDVLFSDGFESGNFTVGGWTVSGSISVDAAAKSAGSYGALFKKISTMTRKLSSVGPGSVTLSYWRRAESLEAGETARVEISSDGQNWVLLETVTGTTAWAAKAFDLSLTAPDLHLRFRLQSNAGNDLFMVDEVAVSGGVANRAPTAVADAYIVDENTVLSVAAPGVLANDTDPEGDPLSAVVIGAPVHGTLSLGADGSFTYTPHADFNGADGFSYQVEDGQGGVASATVSITVQSPGANALHVASILVQTQDAGKKLKRGSAEVVVVDAGGHPVAGVAVIGTFSEDIAETVSATTGTDGKAVLLTTATVTTRSPRLTFCVDQVILTDWTYDVAANLETCDRNY